MRPLQWQGNHKRYTCAVCCHPILTKRLAVVHRFLVRFFGKWGTSILVVFVQVSGEPISLFIDIAIYEGMKLCHTFNCPEKYLSDTQTIESHSVFLHFASLEFKGTEHWQCISGIPLDC